MRRKSKTYDSLDKTKDAPWNGDLIDILSYSARNRIGEVEVLSRTQLDLAVTGDSGLEHAERHDERSDECGG